MKHYFFIFLLLLGSAARAQASVDGLPSWEEEMEDSISAMAIVPIKKPKALLDNIILQAISDSEQEPIPCKYLTMLSWGLYTSRPSISKCILHAKANIEIYSMGEGEEFRYEGPQRLLTLQDTAWVYMDMVSVLEYCSVLKQMENDSERTVFQVFNYLISLHHVKVYSISDESGRGVYRVDFSPRKHIGYGYMGMKYEGTAYFDKNTLRLKYIEADIISSSSYDIYGRQDKRPTLSHSYITHYRTDFEEIGNTLVLKQYEYTKYCDNQLFSKGTVVRLP